MKDKQITELILDAMRKEVEEFIHKESEITDPVEYEEKVLALSRKFAKELIGKSQGKLPKSRNSKKKYWPVLENSNWARSIYYA